MAYVLALDQGTTSSRAILFGQDGALLHVSQKEFTQHFPQDGWVEHEAEEIWDTQLFVAREVLEKAGAGWRDIAGIGITNQRETTVLWDRETGQPISRAIVWQDRRTAGQCESLRTAGHEPEFTRKTGLLLDSYFSGTKIAWMLDNVSGARDHAEAGRLAFGTIDTWLIYRLTGGEVHATDASNASRTLLYNIRQGSWDAALCGLLGVPESVLPEVRDSSGDFGHTTSDLFGGPIPIAGVAGDQQAALFGQMCTEPGMVKNTYGTGCFALMNTGDRVIESQSNLLATVAWSLGGTLTYALEGSVFVAGAAVQWLRDGLGIIRQSSDVEALARSVEDSGGVVMVPAFTGLGAPHWDPYARGLLIGLNRGTTAAHIARATVESLAFQSADLMAAMEKDSDIALRELRVDGGASANDLLMQFQADLVRAQVIRPVVRETTALGAAYLAGLCVGFWDGLDQIKSLRTVDRSFSPTMTEPRAQALTARWKDAVGRSLGWASNQSSGTL